MAHCNLEETFFKWGLRLGTGCKQCLYAPYPLAFSAFGQTEECIQIGVLFVKNRDSRQGNVFFFVTLQMKTNIDDSEHTQQQDTHHYGQ